MHARRGPYLLGAIVLALAFAACKRDSSHASHETGGHTVSTTASAGGSTAGSARVDPELIKSGRVKTANVEKRAPRRELRVSGEIRSSEVGEADVGALVAGRVASLEVGEGARVKKGQILAWVDAPEVGRASAELVRARARARVASQKLTRQLELQGEGATSKNAVDEARADAEISRADLAAARTLLHNLGGQEPPEGSGEGGGPLSVRVPVRAPIPGVVSRHDAVLGAPVSPERTLFRIIAERQVAIIAKIPEGSVRPGLGARAVVRSRGGASTSSAEAARECGAHAVGELGAIEEGTRTLPLRLEPDATCPWLSPGGYVDVAFPLGDSDAGAPTEIIVPADAIVDVKGVPSVFVPGAREGEFERRTVRVRTVLGPDAVIESGLREGERLVVTGALLLKGELLRTELEGH